MVILVSNLSIVSSFIMNSNITVWFSRAAFYLIKILAKPSTRKLPLNSTHLSRLSTISLASFSLFPTPVPQPSTKAGETATLQSSQGTCIYLPEVPCSSKPHEKAQRPQLQPNPTAWYTTNYRNCTDLHTSSQQKAKRLLLLAVT